MASCVAQLRAAMRVRAMKRAMMRNDLSVGEAGAGERELGRTRGFRLCRTWVRTCSSSRSCALLL